MTTRRKKPSKNLVPVGTYVPMTAKLALQAIAESQNMSVYEYIQDLLLGEVQAYEEELEELKIIPSPPKQGDDAGSELL